MVLQKILFLLGNELSEDSDAMKRDAAAVVAGMLGRRLSVSSATFSAVCVHRFRTGLKS